MLVVTSGRLQNEITVFSDNHNYLYRWHDALVKTVQILEPIRGNQIFITHLLLCRRLQKGTRMFLRCSAQHIFALGLAWTFVYVSTIPDVMWQEPFTVSDDENCMHDPHIDATFQQRLWTVCPRRLVSYRAKGQGCVAQTVHIPDIRKGLCLTTRGYKPIYVVSFNDCQ